MDRVIYIAGYGRSGSTVMDMLLSSHPLVFGAGELGRFFEEWSHRGTCSCGRIYSQCPFWQEVISQLNAALPNVNLSIAARVTRATESLFSRPSFLSGTRELQLYRKIWQTMMTAISRVSGKPIIVDSSKSGRRLVRRPQALARLCDLDLSVIHLVRDPRAVMWSVLRGSNRKLEADLPAALPGGAYRALVGWGMANASVHLTQATNPQLEYIRLRYEDVVGNPVQYLHKLGLFLKMDMEPIVDLMTSQHLLDPGHGVAGNRIRRQGPLLLRLDEEWKRTLPRYGRRLALLSWPLAHRYGYDVLRWEVENTTKKPML